MQEVGFHVEAVKLANYCCCPNEIFIERNALADSVPCV